MLKPLTSNLSEVMKNKLIASIAGATAIASALFLTTPYYFGQLAENTLNEQYQMLQNSGFLTVESHQYDRGWFSATETTVVRLKPSLLHNAQRYLPDNLKTVLTEPITIVNHVSHGPFAGGLTLAAAKVNSEIRYQPEAEKVLKRFFGENAPINISNTIGFGGGGKLYVDIPAFEYEELSGIKLNWQGFSGTTAYNKGWQKFQNNYTAPSLHIKLADKGDVTLENLHFESDTYPADKHAIALGSSSVKLDKFSLRWQEGIDYNFKLNELVHLLTDLQIGAFINPTGTIPPSQIVVEKLQFDTKMSAEQQWINSEGRFRFDKLAYGNDVYGPLDIDIAAEHLDAPSLVVLKNKMAEIASKNMSEEEIQTALLNTAKNEASGLFTQNPLIKVRAFDFTMPQGKIHASGQLGFQGLSKTDLNDIQTLLQKTQADFKFDVPQKLLQHLAVSQARSIFTVNPEDAASGEANIEDINETLRLMVDSTIQSMANEGYVTVENGNVSTRIEFGQNHLKFNGKPFKVEPEPEFTDADMVEETASAAQ